MLLDDNSANQVLGINRFCDLNRVREEISEGDEASKLTGHILLVFIGDCETFDTFGRFLAKNLLWLQYLEI